MTGRESVTPLELFFDLVFVYALTQVSELIAEDLGPAGILRGMLVLAVLWWSWVGYAWLGNVVRADEGVVRLAMFGAMAASLVIALAIPESFDDRAGGLPAPVVFAGCYLVVRLAHLSLYWSVSRTDPDLRRQLLRFMPSVAAGTTMLLVASQLHGKVQLVFWVLALVGDFGGTMLGGARGWRVNAPGHFCERHGLIVIVALGESIVSIGIRVVGRPLAWPILAAAALGLAVSALLWWAYFDVESIACERVLSQLQGEARARLARDGYTYLHLPMVAGIILISLGLKLVLEYVGSAEEHTLGDALPGTPLVALYGGVALFLLANVGLKLRALRSVGWPRLTAAVVLVALIPVAATMPALAALAVLVAALSALIGYETWHYAEIRERIRHEHPEAEPAQPGD